MILMIAMEKQNCSGCSACMAVCPRACISMQEDEEGFDYPSVNEALCVNCGLCQTVCPIGKEIEQKIETTGIAVQNNDETIREISSAGGAIGAILSMVFENNGVAFCVGMNEDNIPMFYEVHSMQECREHRVFSSKYVSSIIGNTYQAVKENLDRGG